MAQLNDEGQWIILIGLIISVSIFFLALIVTESVLVGQTTAESVVDFPKSDIHDVRHEVMRQYELGKLTSDTKNDMTRISMDRKNTVVAISATTVGPPGRGENISIHFNNGMTSYNETVYY